ncbi:fungal-specific transcription factor domain-containing protein [Emericellopsis atlantica]|uniref:Fungal-specific transcription factor domain-containing protein n=1 Tax=Emericellopsis atlantica TaxID=2614577 RepID=A0A9P7ZFL5_9HYPO|nr:fungal-specific transcription factor domain-containing protein [Emericellopsis atlantica]KAG9250772.1 fungal-specific transcription factor domain-containing protein [Emericellopsis atlantica]
MSSSNEHRKRLADRQDMAPSTENASSDTAATSAAKRRRIALACTACRLRKSRCDGRRPSSASCASLGFECQYEPSESAANVIVHKGYISDLGQRMSSVEQTIQRLHYVLEGHLSACSGDSQYKSSSQISQPGPPASKDGIGLGRATALEEPRDEDANTNGMAMTFVEEQTSAFFGGSSNINFTRLLLKTVNQVRKNARQGPDGVDRTSEVDERNMAKASASYAKAVAASPDSGSISTTALPSTQEMDVMLDIYFDTAGVVFPFIHEESFRKTYNECNASGWTRVRRTWLGTLNMIFAMASNFDRDSIPSARQRQERSTIFYKRATELCGELAKQVISLETVHYLLLVTFYCQGSQRSVQAWNVHGLAVRSAMALGLHSPPPQEMTNDWQAQYRHRTWVVLYCLDKVLSVAFGRPVCIPDDIMMDQKQILEHTLPSPDGSRTDFDLPGEFLAVSYRLHQVMSASLKRQYGGNIGSSEPEYDDMTALQASGEFRRTLGVWSASLPPHLGLVEPNSDLLRENSQHNRLRVILTLRYHNLNILIHRPLLCSTLRHLFGTSQLSVGNPVYLIQLAMDEAHECFRSAQSTIELVYTILESDQSTGNNLGMGYFSLYYVFTASLVILGRLLWAQHGQADIDKIAVAHCKVLLDQVETILQKLDHDNSLVFGCSRYLHNMLEVFTSQASTASVHHDGVTDYSASTMLRFDPQTSSASAPNQLETMMHLGVGDMEMFQLYSSEIYDAELFEGLDRSSAELATTRNTQ